MRFLRRFCNFFSKSSSASEQEAHTYVHPNGSVSRFVFERRKLYKEGNPKPHVFEQERHPEEGHLETSVCGMQGTPMPRLWQLGQEIRHPMQALAAVEVAVLSISDAGLRCEAAPMPRYDEHGVILGWSEDKAERLSVQQELAAAYIAVHRPPEEAPTGH